MKETWNPAEISEDIKPVNYVSADSWNAAELNEAINLFGIKYPVDTWNPAELDEKTRNIIHDITSIKNITGNPISFKTINGGYAKSCEVAFAPIQSGSGDPSPKNVRPISGRDSVVLNQYGKNLFNKNAKNTDNGYIANQYLNFQGYPFSPTTTPENWFVSEYINVKPNTKYTISGLATSSSNAPSICEYDSDKSFVTGYSYSNRENFTITTSSTTRFIRLSAGLGQTYWDTIQLEEGDSATSYNAYNGQTHTATFSDTVYGGMVDFVSGKAKSEWGYISSYDGETITEPWISDRDVYVAGTTPSTGAEVCYKLETPQEITLSPETIALLKGNNTLWTDGDSIELKYTKLALPDDSDGLSLNQKVRKAIEIIKGKAINEEIKKEETKKSTTKGRRKKS